jgi:hypothetical protein
MIAAAAAGIALSLGLGLGLVSVLFSQPIFATGVWQQSEPVVMAVHAGAGLCWLGLAGAARPGDLLSRLRSPLLLPILALAAWGGLCAALSDHPIRAVLGPPQSGEGVLWSLDAAAYVLAAWWLRDQSPKRFGQLAWLGAAVVLAVGLCNAPLLRAETAVGRVPSFFSFPKFLGFSALGLFPVAWWSRRSGRPGWPALLAIAAAGLVLSDNRTALCGLVMILPIALAPRLAAGPWDRRLVLALGAGGVVVAALLPYVLLRHTGLFQDSASLWSRSILLAAVDGHILDSPATALFGHGWGGYPEYLARNVAETGISLVDGSWKDLTRDEFHSHSAIIEAAFSIGLPGAVLLLLSRIGLLLGAAPGAWAMALPFALSLSLTEATWFMLPVSLAVLGLGIAALAPPVEPTAPAATGTAIRAAALGLGIAGLAVSALLLTHARATRHVVNCVRADRCPAVPVPPALAGDGAETAALILSIDGGRAGVRPNPSLAAMVRSVARQSDRPPSALLSLALAGTFGRAAFLPDRSRLGPLTPQDESLWQGEILRLAELAPGRLDIAAIYLNWLVKQGREEADQTVLPLLESHFPAHPVVRWFRGLRLIARSDEASRQAGLSMLRQALDAGVGRFVEIPADAQAALRQSK